MKESILPVLTIMLGGAFALLALLSVMTVFADMSLQLKGYSRCSTRGYHTSEVVIHWPMFWNADTICYGDGEARKGVKL